MKRNSSIPQLEAGKLADLSSALVVNQWPHEDYWLSAATLALRVSQFSSRTFESRY